MRTVEVIADGDDLIVILYCKECGKPFHHKLPKYHDHKCYSKSLEKKEKNLKVEKTNG